MAQKPQDVALAALLGAALLLGGVFLAARAFHRRPPTPWDPVNIGTRIKEQMRQVNGALVSYRRDVGCFPTTEEGLRVLVEQPAGTSKWKGPYLPEVPKDPWGKMLTYRLKLSDQYELICTGPDMMADTDDDIIAVGPESQPD